MGLNPEGLSPEAIRRAVMVVVMVIVVVLGWVPGVTVMEVMTNARRWYVITDDDE